MEYYAELQAIAKSADTFANKYFKVLTKSNPGNLITSPLSAQIVLAMAAYGAAGETAVQMRSALKLPRNDRLGRSGYQSLIKTLNDEKGVELRLANKMFTASFFDVKPAHKEITTKNFLSPSQEIDFNDPETAAEVINTWCEEQTNKRIKNVVSPGSLPQDTRMILMNAVYFKGQWANKFNPVFTKDRIFHIDENTTKHVPTMFIERRFKSGNISELDAEFVEIPYQGEQLSMIIIRPNDINGLKKIQNNLHKVQLKHRLESIYPTWLDLYLPKFKIENDLVLTSILEKLGMTSMFRADRANFSGIGDVPLNITSVLQTAFIEVNEEGSEAFVFARLVAGGPEGSSPTPPPPSFKVDRPFYFVIYHYKTGISLFTGVIHEPNSR